jgi:thiol:disulfide interchange protein
MLPVKISLSLLFCALLVAFTGGSGLARQDGSNSRSAPVKPYDPARDPEKDLQDAIRQSQQNGKRILLDVGGEWCIWCHKLDAFFENNPQLLELRESNFIFLKINFSPDNQNKQFLSRYPRIQGYPHLFVLDSNGKLLQSQDTDALELGSSYDLHKVESFLKEWARPPHRSSRSVRRQV